MVGMIDPAVEAKVAPAPGEVYCWDRASLKAQECLTL